MHCDTAASQHKKRGALAHLLERETHGANVDQRQRVAAVHIFYLQCLEARNEQRF